MKYKHSERELFALKMDMPKFDLSPKIYWRNSHFIKDKAQFCRISAACVDPSRQPFPKDQDYGLQLRGGRPEHLGSWIHQRREHAGRASFGHRAMEDHPRWGEHFCSTTAFLDPIFQLKILHCQLGVLSLSIFDCLPIFFFHLFLDCFITHISKMDIKNITFLDILCQS